MARLWTWREWRFRVSAKKLAFGARERLSALWAVARRWLINVCGLHKLPWLKKHALPKKDQERCGIIRKQLVFGLLLLLAIDPFELQESTLATSDLVSDRLSATAYTAPSADRIAVVLVDDNALDDSNAYWPPAFPFWTHLLGKVLQHNPAAVYFDISFDYPRPSFSTPDDGPPQPDSARAADEAGAFAALMTGGHVPVILGSQGRLAAMRAPLAGCANPARNGERTSVIPVLACAAAETDFFDYTLPPDGRGYPLWTAWPDGKSFVQSRLPAPALAARSCQVLHPAPGWCAQGVSWLSMPSMLRKPDNVAVIPQWSRYTSDLASPPNPANFAGCTRYPPGSDGERDWNWVKTLVSEALAGPVLRWLPGNFTEIQDTAGTAAEPCLPFPVIPASKLLDLSGKYRQNLTGLLQNRIVLIGDGRRYSPDYVAAPLHQTLPGVISQATVLETLLTAGPRYPQISNHLRFRQNEYEAIMKIGILLLAIGLDIWAERRREALKSKDQSRLSVRLRRAAWGARDVTIGRGKPLQLALQFILNNSLSLLFAFGGIGVVTVLLEAGAAPANWIFLIVEILLISLGLGELRAPGHEDDDTEGGNNATAKQPTAQHGAMA